MLIHERSLKHYSSRELLMLSTLNDLLNSRVFKYTFDHHLTLTFKKPLGKRAIEMINWIDS